MISMQRLSISSPDPSPKSVASSLKDLRDFSFEEELQLLFKEQKEADKSDNSKHSSIPPFFFEEMRITIESINMDFWSL